MLGFLSSIFAADEPPSEELSLAIALGEHGATRTVEHGNHAATMLQPHVSGLHTHVLEAGTACTHPRCKPTHLCCNPTHLRCNPTHPGARLTHDHRRQYGYVQQSLTLWREVANDMFRLWCLAEEDEPNTATLTLAS